MDSSGLESPGFKKTVEAPGCVCLIILYTRVFSANMQGCTVCLLNTVFPFKKNEGSVGSSFLEASWWACMRVFRKKNVDQVQRNT